MTLAVLSALFIWWFSTGIIIFMIGQGCGRRAVLGAAPLAAWAGWLLVQAGEVNTVAGAYTGFATAIFVWGWFEFAFLTGVITGPNRHPCPPGARGWERFRLAWATIAHHELAILAVAVSMGVLLWNAPNQTGLWTFLVLFAARVSAKLNVYLGVPNFTDEIMPAPVSHLKSYFAKRWMNLMFPVSITGLTAALVIWIEGAILAPTSSGAEIGFALLATLTSLALLEHWLMVLPVRDSLLWRWMTPKPKLEGPRRPSTAE